MRRKLHWAIRQWLRMRGICQSTLRPRTTTSTACCSRRCSRAWCTKNFVLRRSIGPVGVPLGNACRPDFVCGVMADRKATDGRLKSGNWAAQKIRISIVCEDVSMLRGRERKTQGRPKPMESRALERRHGVRAKTPLRSRQISVPYQMESIRGDRLDL